MSRLDDFLSLPNVSDVKETIFVNDRLGKFTITPMSINQHKSYQDRCKSNVKKDGIKFDSTKFNMLILVNHVIDPDFTNAEFLKKCGYTTAVDFVNAKIFPGEVAEIASKICSLSGFDLDLSETVNEDIDEAKN